ncbi:MAG: hypothetical protein J2P46_21455 [Zavarzinella sp.]|nr:hypothetical protein [Zavarzinella sp.]
MFSHRWTRRIAIALIAGFGLVVAGTFYFRHTTRQAGEERLAAVIAELDATDPRWRLDDIEADRGYVPDDQNSALLVPKFQAALTAKDFVVTRPGVTREGVFENLPPNRALDDQGATAIDHAMEGNDAALAIARSFKDYPRGLRRYSYTPDFIGTKLPGLQETRQIVAMLDVEAERLSRDGRPGAALELVRAMLNAARSIEGEPFLISCLVRTACDSLAVRRVERTLGLSVLKGGLNEVQTALLREADADLFWTGLRGERAGMDMLMTNLRTGRLSVSTYRSLASGAGGPAPPVRVRIGDWVREPHVSGDQATYLETITRAREVRHLPEHQQRAALKVIPVPPDEVGTALTRLLLPNLAKLHDPSLRTKAHLRCVAVGLAIEQFRQIRGRWPESLEELPRGLLPAVPLDPFDGKPLKYARRADGVTIYSIGLDEQDNGGNIVDGPRWTPDPRGEDIGFRLYNPDFRALPPLPRPSPGGAIDVRPGRGLLDDDSRPGPLPYPREVGTASARKR